MRAKNRDTFTTIYQVIPLLSALPENYCFQHHRRMIRIPTDLVPVSAQRPPSNPTFFRRLLTNSSHVFHESRLYEFFSRNFMFHFFRGLQGVFFCYASNSFISAFLILIENLYLVEKQSKENLVEKYRRFRNRENML